MPGSARGIGVVEMQGSDSAFFQDALRDFAIESGYLIAILIDPQGRIIDYNKGFEFTVRPAGDPRNRRLSTFMAYADGAGADAEPEVLPGLAGGPPIPYKFRAWRGHELLLHAYPCDDEQVLLIGSAIGYDDSQTAKRMSRLTTEMGKLVRDLRRSNQRVQKVADHDALTGLANRRHFLERLVAAMQHADETDHPLCVLMADLDHFKRINDTFGHAAGDTVLRKFSALLSQGARAADLAGRLGGEEFALMLPDTDSEPARSVGERIRLVVAELMPLGEGHPVTVSIGLARYQAGDTTDSLLARADSALYQAKDGGRNQVVVYAAGGEDQASEGGEQRQVG
jgi:diguanylate cyclase (GGDEF)-like protein